ncbi:MAG: T9SS type A sorting domain-containing protein, partial [candidate division KSB1 bacterium]|nr:T9SS type A sorting domain-containing protein [candidate division KSB1 bacterium]
MDANKNVTATFTEIIVEEIITHEETKTGGSSGANTVMTSESVAGVSGHLYLAAVSTKPRVNVIAVTGLGLNWTRVKAQCSGRNTTGIEVWMAQGTPIGNGTVTATLISEAHNAVLAVSRYAGAATANPLGNVVSANTAGLEASCANGVDGAAYSFPVTTTVSGAKIFTAAAMRNRTHTPGSGYIERGERRQGDLAGTMAAVAVQDRNAASAATFVASGEFNGTVDWAAVAVEIKPQLAAKPSAMHNDKESINAIAAVEGYRLYRNYPNPLRASAFDSQTEITYYLPEASNVRLVIFNTLGQTVRQLVDEFQAAGYQRARWDGKNAQGAALSAGIYFYQLEAGSHRLTGKMILQP